MIYQNPQILYALLALAIPIVIHLFNFRKHEKIYFSSIRFLEEIKTKNKKKRNLKNLIRQFLATEKIMVPMSFYFFLVLLFLFGFVSTLFKNEKI